MRDTKTPPPERTGETAVSPQGEPEEEKFLDYHVLIEAIEDSIEQRVLDVTEQFWHIPDNQKNFRNRYGNEARQKFEEVFNRKFAPTKKREAGLEGLSNSEAFVEEHGDMYTSLIRSLLGADGNNFTLTYGSNKIVEISGSRDGTNYQLMSKSEIANRHQVREIIKVRDGDEDVDGLDTLFSDWKRGGNMEFGTAIYSISTDDGERSSGYLRIGTFRYRVIRYEPFTLKTLAEGLRETLDVLKKVDAIRYKPAATGPQG